MTAAAPDTGHAREVTELMKKRLLFFAVLAAAILAVFSAAAAEEAEEFAPECRFTSSGGKYKITRLTDRAYDTTFVCTKRRNPWIQADAPEGKQVYGVYLSFGDLTLRPWEIQVLTDGKWTAVYTSQGLYAHEFAPLEGVSSFRVVNSQDKQTELNVEEIFVFGEGDIPSWVQKWEPTHEKADLLVLAAHPDDEILFLGGTIPYYASERGKKVVVAYMTCGTSYRRSELLDGLWYAGVRNYPVIGNFWDKYSKKLDTAYKAWGKTATYKFVTGLIRTYRPEVVVTHDVNGEYGHGAHRACADACRACVAYAADGAKWKDLGEGWQVKKLYLHLYGENAIVMDWDAPMASFGGMTGFEAAEGMYAFHVSQHAAGQKNEKGVFEVFRVEPRDSACSCYRFGLAFSMVGEDVFKNDFFENIPE
ncbi:MAG: PIG-L family deacetylase [Clostridia bacterium]|nr:PIG-L family deacetylase [Clostridia bacterium]